MNIIQLFGIVLIAGLAVGIVFKQFAIPRLVGFVVGGELKHPIFKKYGKQFLFILLS